MPTNFGELFWRAARLYPDKVVIEQGDVTVTYAQLEARAQRVARMVSERGIGMGDKVMLLLPNDYRFAEILFGVVRTGAIAVPANIKLGMDTLSYIAAHSDSKLLIGHADLIDKIAAALPHQSLVFRQPRHSVSPPFHCLIRPSRP